MQRSRQFLGRVSFFRAVFVACALLFMNGCPKHRAQNQKPLSLSKTAENSDTKSASFKDVTQEAGLVFCQSHGGCGLNYFVEQVAAGAAFLDANNDGFLDIYFPQPKLLGKCKLPQKLRQRLYLNDGKGHFQLAPNAFGNAETAYGIAAAVGDYNNDGKDDIYVACYGGNTLFRGRGDGTFDDVSKKAGVTLGGFSTGATWFDFDRDGHLDLYVTRYCEWSVEKDIACPGPKGKRSVCNPTVYPPAYHALFHNKGDGTFEDVTKKAGVGKEARRGLGVVTADFNKDGWTDLFVSNDLSPNFLFINQKNDTFKEEAMQQSVAFGLDGHPQANMGTTAADFDEDGDMDSVVTTFSNEPYTFYRNDGAYFTDVSGTNGLFAATMPFLGFGVVAFDARNNGTLDLFFANGHVNPYIQHSYSQMTQKQLNQLLLNDGKGNFTEDKKALPKSDQRVHRGAASGDVNNDGRVDIVVTANDDRPTLLLNESAHKNWLTLKLTNRFGCTSPIGAQCIATIDGKKQLRVVTGGGSYGGESDHRVHFGLGEATKVEKIEIKWLSGTIQTLENVQANQILTVREIRNK